VPEAAETFFESLTTLAAISALIDAGEAEGLYLEAKAPASPQLYGDQKPNLAEANSSFANTAGGAILWGGSATRHAHSNLDALAQIEPIGA
jgi:hypothetical protein